MDINLAYIWDDIITIYQARISFTIREVKEPLESLVIKPFLISKTIDLKFN